MATNVELGNPASYMSQLYETSSPRHSHIDASEPIGPQSHLFSTFDLFLMRMIYLECPGNQLDTLQLFRILRM